MGSASRASLVVAATMAAVEALKDQAGLCRWNYALTSLQKHAKSKAKSFPSRPKLERARFNNSSASMVGEEMMKRRQAEKAERVYHLVCWGPN